MTRWVQHKLQSHEALPTTPSCKRRLAQDEANLRFLTSCTARNQDPVIIASPFRVLEPQIPERKGLAFFSKQLRYFTEFSPLQSLIFIEVLVKPSEDLVMPLQAENDSLTRDSPRRT